MDDMRQTIIPKSDQLNADDLIGREMTIKITGVDIRGGQEQPVSIHFEGDNGKPYKACKSMCRVMVSAWGPDSKKYVGRSMTLYRDPKVKWGGMEVGGIRISHMSHISDDMTMALTVTRANRKPFTVRPIQDRASGSNPPSAPPSAEAAGAPSGAESRTDTLHRLCEEAGMVMAQILAKAEVDSAEAMSESDWASAVRMLKKKAASKVAT